MRYNELLIAIVIHTVILLQKNVYSSSSSNSNSNSNSNNLNLKPLPSSLQTSSVLQGHSASPSSNIPSSPLSPTSYVGPDGSPMLLDSSGFLYEGRTRKPLLHGNGITRMTVEGYKNVLNGLIKEDPSPRLFKLKDSFDNDINEMNDDTYEDYDEPFSMESLAKCQDTCTSEDTREQYEIISWNNLIGEREFNERWEKLQSITTVEIFPELTNEKITELANPPRDPIFSNEGLHHDTFHDSTPVHLIVKELYEGWSDEMERLEVECREECSARHPLVFR